MRPELLAHLPPPQFHLPAAAPNGSVTRWGGVAERLFLVATSQATDPRTSQFNPLRCVGNGVINIDASAANPNEQPRGPYVVTLSPIVGTNGGSPLTVDTNWLEYAALVKWGRGGARHEALVDWPFAGSSFIVDGDQLYVEPWALRVASGLPTVPITANVRMQAHATPVTDGSRAGILPPRRTMHIGTIANAGGTSGEVWLPTYARRWRWYWNNTVVAGTWNLAFLYRRFGNTFAQDVLIGGSSTRGILDTTIGAPWDLPPQTQTMVVNNNTVAALTVLDGAIIFDLDLA